MALRPFDYARTRRSIFEALIEAKKRYGGKKQILEDADRNPIDYDRIVLGSFVLGRKMAAVTSPGENVGLMIANSVGGVVAFFGLMAFGRVAAMLNFTAGARNIRMACETAKIKTIITARRFVTQGNLTQLVDELAKSVNIVYLEDLREQIGAMDKVRGLADATMPSIAMAKPNPDDLAVLLFTSGTEGAPKGVALSHANLVANVEQVATHVELLPDDVIFNPLPIFHSFGLLGGTLWPVLTGMKSVLFPSPLQAKNIVKLISETKSTLLFATDTFANQYARVCENNELASLRFICCGAERVKPETRELFTNKLNIIIIEGYGATEASPVIAVNTPNEFNRPGTVGRFVPAIEWKLESIPGIDGGGRLYVKGPNLMMGYMRIDAPGEIQPIPDGWHDTGDVVSIDKEGYVTIRGRVKRFAKIGGEMVSLTAVEGNASAVWPDELHVALAINDPKKGEQIVLLTNRANASRSELQEWYKANGASELGLPRKILTVEEIPVLGTGKIDYVGAQKLLEASESKAA